MYFPSLANYPEQYIHLFFIDPSNPPEHIVYLCPLCLKNGIVVAKGNGVGMHTEFSYDHYPPESVGKQATMLVCKKCNNDAGMNYDFSLKEKIHNMAFNNRIPTAKLKSISTITDVTGSYHSEIIINEAGEFDISLKPNEKIHAPYLDEFIEYSKEHNDYKISLTLKLPDEHKVSKALVKTAYLTCFNYWGYEFAFSNTGEMIRKFLNDECEYPVKNPSFWLGEQLRSGNLKHLPSGLCYLQSPVEWKCFIVNIRLVDKASKFAEIASVLIPGPSKENWDDLKKIQTFLDDEPTVSVTMAHVTEHSITDRIFDGYSRSWNSLMGNS